MFREEERTLEDDLDPDNIGRGHAPGGSNGHGDLPEWEPGRKIGSPPPRADLDDLPWLDEQPERPDDTSA